MQGDVANTDEINSDKEDPGSPKVKPAMPEVNIHQLSNFFEFSLLCVHCLKNEIYCFEKNQTSKSIDKFFFNELNSEDVDLE